MMMRSVSARKMSAELTRNARARLAMLDVNEDGKEHRLREKM